MNYSAFLESKAVVDAPSGFDPGQMPDYMFEFQADITRWALRRGRAAIFADCGLGKTIMQLKWADAVHQHTGGNVLILAPLAVSAQTVNEGKKFGIDVNRCMSGTDVKTGINITNYERIDNFDIESFDGLVLDESSILKSYTGKYRTEIINRSVNVPYRLACTATPAPNDYMEIGNHAEFLGIMGRTEMLSMFFVHDSGDTSKWRLKGHADSGFWAWLASWSVMIAMPSDLGYKNNGFALPPMSVESHVVQAGNPLTGKLFIEPASTLMERRQARRESIEDRCRLSAEIANGIDGPVLVWCDMNDESALLTKLIDGAVEIKGADKPSHKENAMMGFSDGSIRCLVTKPSIAGFGMNWQHCANMIFTGLSDSYEKYYQAVRRCWRFGQTKPVTVHIVTSDMEGAVVENIARKEAQSENMHRQMIEHMADISSGEIRCAARDKSAYSRHVESSDNWTLHLGDCVDVWREIETNSIGYTIFSPPFASLYTYSNSERDMGNAKNDGEFFTHFKFLVDELFRTTAPGRAVSFHCMNLPLMKERHGYIGLNDFRGDMIRLFVKAGFIFHSEHVIWKDPLIEATRTKALGLMHKQLCKDSSMCRAGIPDYLVTMRKPGQNQDPIQHPKGLTEFIGLDEPEGGTFSHNVWRRYASPVWMDINQTRTLNHRQARDAKDERHICPLQLDVIERGITLWSKKGDLVASPFAGIGSEGYVAVKSGRRFVGSELKRSYFDVAIKNLAEATEKSQTQATIF